MHQQPLCSEAIPSHYMCLLQVMKANWNGSTVIDWLTLSHQEEISPQKMTYVTDAMDVVFSATITRTMLVLKQSGTSKPRQLEMDQQRHGTELLQRAVSHIHMLSK